MPDATVTGPLGRLVYCLTCGRLAALSAISLDSRHPIIRCTRTDDEGIERGCGSVPGTYDRAEAEAIVELRRRKRITKMHDQHVRAGRRSDHCDKCDAEPPPTRATIHKYAPITERTKLAAHLEFGHADRTMRVNLLTRPLEPDIAHHRELHDRALAERSPAIGEAIVIDGRKYRIRELDERLMQLAGAGPSWRRSPIELVIDGRTPLAWDGQAAVWRRWGVGS